MCDVMKDTGQKYQVSVSVSLIIRSIIIFGFLSFFSFYRYWFRSNLSITPGSANLEILLKKKKKKKKKHKKTQKPLAEFLFK